MFEGTIIKETIIDELLLDYIQINKVEIWKTNDTIKYWTMIFFTSDNDNFPEKLSKVILEEWFADMKKNDTKYIVFKNAVYKYQIGNSLEKDNVLNELRKRGIPEEQFNWTE